MSKIWWSFSWFLYDLIIFYLWKYLKVMLNMLIPLPEAIPKSTNPLFTTDTTVTTCGTINIKGAINKPMICKDNLFSLFHVYQTTSPYKLWGVKTEEVHIRLHIRKLSSSNQSIQKLCRHFCEYVVWYLTSLGMAKVSPIVVTHQTKR